VPTPRTLASAVTTDRNTTRVVCQKDSYKLAQSSIGSALRHGYVLRPSQPRVTVTATEAHALLDTNRRLYQRCRFSSIQDAINQSGNNDRVVVMPGLYTEEESRAAPTHDPACSQYLITNDHGDAQALSYKYQVYCPNDANLISITGREPGATDPPNPPLTDRHGIPDLGPCVRCNFQLEGSGVSPDDVIIEAGDPKTGDEADNGPCAKDVGIFVDRADGAVIRNFKVRHTCEHGIYSLETDGLLVDRFKTMYAEDYGVLTFVLDHARVSNCEAKGSGDSGIYPGGSADTGAQRDTAPQAWKDYTDPNVSYGMGARYSVEIANCDSHHNTGGYSGTDGNATWIHDTNFYDNTLGFTTDVFTAPGHPGFPQDSDLIENNRFYDNNFNPYTTPSGAVKPHCTQAQIDNHQVGDACTDVDPSIPVPVGTGLWIAGGNDNILRNNFFYNNHRRGLMLFAVPDQFVCGPGFFDPAQLPGCNPNAVPPSTSYRNEYVGNIMGRTPGGQVQPNGNGDLSNGYVDFWWDQYEGTTGNCWHGNVGQNGTNSSITSLPVAAPEAGANVPGALPSVCDTTSVGSGSAQQESELVNCLGDIEFDTSTCPWFTDP
jgi:hypothetical protein